MMSDTPVEPIIQGIVTGAGALTAPPSKINDKSEEDMAIEELRRARMYEAAMASLIEAQSALSIPIAHLAGFAVELGLKAYLFTKHKEEDVVKVRHDLVKAWKKAHKAGLEIPVDRPEWLKRLHCLHGNMLLRYPHSTIGGLVLPNQSVYRQGIAELLSAVERHVEK